MRSLTRWNCACANWQSKAESRNYHHGRTWPGMVQRGFSAMVPMTYMPPSGQTGNWPAGPGLIFVKRHTRKTRGRVPSTRAAIQSRSTQRRQDAKTPRRADGPHSESGSRLRALALQSVKVARFRGDFVKIAQPFMAGYTGQISQPSPVRDGRSFVPDGTCFVFLSHDPPLKRWAIFLSNRSEFHRLWVRRAALRLCAG
jgi:hypothetical protein